MPTDIPALIERLNDLTRDSLTDRTDAATALAEQAEEIELAREGYLSAVYKFDACRAALARRYKAHSGEEPNPQDAADRPWHEWLIERSDRELMNIAALRRQLAEAREVLQKATECDCGLELSHGNCPICDNDE